jgi:hypothetical protein
MIEAHSQDKGVVLGKLDEMKAAMLKYYEAQKARRGSMSVTCLLEPLLLTI